MYIINNIKIKGFFVLFSKCLLLAQNVYKMTQNVYKTTQNVYKTTQNVVLYKLKNKCGV